MQRGAPIPLGVPLQRHRQASVLQRHSCLDRGWYCQSCWIRVPLVGSVCAGNGMPHVILLIDSSNCFIHVYGKSLRPFMTSRVEFHCPPISTAMRDTSVFLALESSSKNERLARMTRPFLHRESITFVRRGSAKNPGDFVRTSDTII